MSRAGRLLRRAAGGLLLAAFALTFVPSADAQEYVAVGGALADEDFYRVVACAAAPGAGCRKPFLHWAADRRGDVTVGLVQLAGTGPAPQAFDAGLDAAVAEINGSGAGIRLRRTDAMPDIAIYVVPTRPGEVMRRTGLAELDGVRLPLAQVSVRTRNGVIRQASIAVSAHARSREVPSLLLEEIVQGLGLITDIRGPAYRQSIFAEDSNLTVRLQGQDLMALRRHYAAELRYAALDLPAYRAIMGEVASIDAEPDAGSRRGRATQSR